MKKKLNCILLIDDDEATNYLSNMIIEEADCTHHIKIKQTAKGALNYLSESSKPSNGHQKPPFPDLIFLDINLPAMDGWEFLEKYRELKNNLEYQPVIIMLSTSINPDDKVKALSIPEVSDFHNKPMTPEMIETIVSEYFPG